MVDKAELAKQMAALRRLIERASGDLRQVAVELATIATALERSQPGRAGHVAMVARRVEAVANLLTLEMAAGTPATVALAGRLARFTVAAAATVASWVGAAAVAVPVDALIERIRVLASDVDGVVDLAERIDGEIEPEQLALDAAIDAGFALQLTLQIHGLLDSDASFERGMSAVEFVANARHLLAAAHRANQDDVDVDDRLAEFEDRLEEVRRLWGIP